MKSKHNIYRVSCSDRSIKSLYDDLKDYDTIVLNHDFNEPLDYLPPNIKRIYWDNVNYLFDHPLNNLPANLEELDLSALMNFNQKLDKLPSRLKKLSIGGNNFQQMLDSLPSSLEQLEIGDKYNQKLSGLPIGLKTLVIKPNSVFKQELDNLPNGLENLIMYNYFIPRLDNLPCGLKKLYVESRSVSPDNLNFDKIPDKLEILKISPDNLNSPINNLPNTLKKLVLNISCNYSVDLNNLPLNLEFLHLTFDSNLAYELKLLPAKIKTLVIEGSKTNIGLIDYPKNLLNLKISNSILANNLNLPNNLELLQILTDGGYYDKNLKIKMPPKLKYFESEDYNAKFKLEIIKFSQVLETFIVHSSFNQEIFCFPNSLKVLMIDNPDYNCLVKKLPDKLEKLFLRANIAFDISLLPSTISKLYLDTRFIDVNIKNNYKLSNRLEFLGVCLNQKYYANWNHIIGGEEHKYENSIEYIQKIINMIPDSVKYLSMELEMRMFYFNRLPSNLQELKINELYSVIPVLNFVEYFKSCECTNDFDSIDLDIIEDRDDVKLFNYYMYSHFIQNPNRNNLATLYDKDEHDDFSFFRNY
jgi:hypothetical protein